MTDFLTSRADVALPWYFGTGSDTAAGDAGLRSHMHGQLVTMKASQTHDGGGVLEKRNVDLSVIEDSMHSRLDAASRMQAVSARLAALSDEHQAILHLHYGQRRLAFAVSGCAVLTEAAARLVSHPQTRPFEWQRVAVTREGLNAALRAAQGASETKRAWVGVELEAQGLLGPARAAYEGVRLEPRRASGWQPFHGRGTAKVG